MGTLVLALECAARTGKKTLALNAFSRLQLLMPTPPAFAFHAVMHMYAMADDLRGY